MSIHITWYGHATWLISLRDGSEREFKILLDPFLRDSPTASIECEDVSADVILVSHGHFDHVADVAEIAARNDAIVVANFEIATWFTEKQSVKNTVGMNIGGHYALESGSVKMTHAIHSSQLPDGSYGGNPGGFLLTIENKTIYFACDTALFSDMKLIGRTGIDLAVLPIGDLFTMGISDSIEAVKLVAPSQVLPTHYNTWPPIEQDAAAWAERVKAETSARPIVLSPGQSHEL